MRSNVRITREETHRTCLSSISVCVCVCVCLRITCILHLPLICFRLLSLGVVRSGVLTVPQLLRPRLSTLTITFVDGERCQTPPDVDQADTQAHTQHRDRESAKNTHTSSNTTTTTTNGEQKGNPGKEPHFTAQLGLVIPLGCEFTHLEQYLSQNHLSLCTALGKHDRALKHENNMIVFVRRQLLLAAITKDKDVRYGVCA
jgi:hypothetical protein